ncbi:SIR2 family NAD-dependent protein deacylase [Pleionea sediminis]|uniref:SIR2 family NAD-dependent protein deacylase n=1 Tax=Pleionea sediminis TaxID=2569479 RepID=UPI001184A765|nr:NAD-dependent deacylase [Pleionea sediminis]
MNNSDIQNLYEWLTQAECITVMTGAGVSAESGISTFRDAQEGLWSKYDPMEMASPEGFSRDPELVWSWYQWRRQQVQQASPNAAHLGIAELQKRLKLYLITQNVDGLHQQAGSTEVIELHGHLFENRCHNSQCDYHESVVDIEEPLKRCNQCQSAYLRPSVVWFGESLDASVIDMAQKVSQQCDLFLSVGTSSEVYPAAGFANVALQAGAKLIEINPNATSLSSKVDLLIAKPAGQVFKHLMSLFDD